MYSRYNYYKYYEAKKHLYQERYLDKKEKQKRLDEIYKDYGGEKEYIRDYWVNKRWKNKILTNSNDRSETNESNQS
jgi:DNA invertase Pin-like site-specific DNA recombinase